MSERLSLDTIVVASGDQVSADLDGEAVVLDLKDGVYFGLNATGTQVWTRLQQPCSARELLSALLATYPDLPAEQGEADLLSMLENLQELGLIEVVGA
ncbi:MAG: PqqD family protein [Gemmatimonadetes bacterium]|nr:PqqD family protein [Gemmatimonadota bacterium]